MFRARGDFGHVNPMGPGPPARQLPDWIWEDVAAQRPALSRADAVKHVNKLLEEHFPAELPVKEEWYKKHIGIRRARRIAAENAVPVKRPLSEDDTVEEDGTSATGSKLPRHDDAARGGGEASVRLDDAIRRDADSPLKSPSRSPCSNDTILDSQDPNLDSHRVSDADAASVRIETTDTNADDLETSGTPPCNACARGLLCACVWVCACVCVNAIPMETNLVRG